VPVKVVLHKINAFSGYGMGNNHHRFFDDGFSHIAGVNYCFYIISVNF